MDWQNPKALYLILPTCIGWLAIALYSQARRSHSKQLFVAKQMSERIMPAHSTIRFWTKMALRQVAIISGLVAIAGPRFGEQYEQIIPRGSDLYVLIDVSRSMLADDVSPTRLGRAKADVSSLLNRLEGERIGLVAFAGQAVVKCPLTVDYNSFRRALNELDPNSAPRGGTAIGDAIRKSLEVFQSNSERDQAILLITDGDDQQSYPLEAATVAAERKVTIFAIGLGDAERGSRIPQKDSSGLFVEHQGEQIWSKLNGDLLQEIALKTSGVYIPAGTRSYDLGELYSKYLQGRRGDDSASQSRIRRTERFQIFLAVALIALLIDLFISPFRNRSIHRLVLPNRNALRSELAQNAIAISIMLFTSGLGIADDTTSKVREGLRYYADQKFDEAQDAFASAASKLEEVKSAKASVAIFDEACAFHRKGDFDKARDKYLQAGLSQDRVLATSAHFNLGMLSSEKARSIAGDQPENATIEKRTEILESLKQAIASYRHCLELNPKHSPSRRNLEIVRQWIKYYTDKWEELDRQKRRNETNLLQFLEYLQQAQSSIRELVEQLPPSPNADTFAELKQTQDELAREIPVLKEKIEAELRPPTDAQSQSPQSQSAQSTKELDEGIAILKGWADEAGKKMVKASSQLSKSIAKDASNEQKAAIEELDRIWDAIVSFHPLLAKELSDQTSLVRGIGTTSVDESQNRVEQPDKRDEVDPTPSQGLTMDEPDWIHLQESQEKSLRKARLLAPKAEAELSQLENQPQPDNTSQEKDPTLPIDPSQKEPQQEQIKKVDPEEIKAGLRKAIELAPKAVVEMESASKQIRRNDRVQASIHAEEARRILQEIQDSQPKNPQQDQQDQPKDDQKNEDQKDKDEKKDKSDDQKEQEDQKKPDNKEQQKPKLNQVSKDRMEDALRKVREREQEKHERDRELRARILGRTPVDKDW